MSDQPAAKKQKIGHNSVNPFEIHTPTHTKTSSEDYLYEVGEAERPAGSQAGRQTGGRSSSGGRSARWDDAVFPVAAAVLVAFLAPPPPLPIAVDAAGVLG